MVAATIACPSFWGPEYRYSLLSSCRLRSFLSQSFAHGGRCVEGAAMLEARYCLFYQVWCHVVRETHYPDGLDVVAFMARDCPFEVGALELHHTTGEDASLS